MFGSTNRLKHQIAWPTKLDNSMDTRCELVVNWAVWVLTARYDRPWLSSSNPASPNRHLVALLARRRTRGLGGRLSKAERQSNMATASTQRRQRQTAALVIYERLVPRD